MEEIKTGNIPKTSKQAKADFEAQNVQCRTTTFSEFKLKASRHEIAVEVLVETHAWQWRRKPPYAPFRLGFQIKHAPLL